MYPEIRQITKQSTAMPIQKNSVQDDDISESANSDFGRFSTTKAVSMRGIHAHYVLAEIRREYSPELLW